MSKSKRIKIKSKQSHFSSSDTAIALWSIAILAFMGLTIALSMGTRTPHSQNSMTGYFSKIRSRLRGWEERSIPSASLQSVDSRSNTAFHFQWNKKFNPPAWSISPKSTSNRNEDIQKTLRTGKSKLSIQPRPETQELYDLTENLLNDSAASIRKRILPLQPGEKLTLSYPAGGGLSRPWKLRIRALGVTQDRLDAPLTLTHGFTQSERKSLDIDPKGQSTDLDLPSSNEFARRGEKNYTIEWPNTASGILSIEGFQPILSDQDPRNSSARTMIVYVDQLDGSLGTLNLTLSALKKTASTTNTQILFTNVFPPAQSSELSQKTLLTWRNPIELGATQSNEKLRNFINPEPYLLNKYSERGGSIRRLSLNQLAHRCTSNCSNTRSKDDWLDQFTSTIEINRKDEFSSVAEIIRNDEFFTDAGLLLVDLRFPAESLRLNWTTAFESQRSIFRWIKAGLFEFIGKPDFEFKNLEKTAQLDILVSKTIESFFVTSAQSNIGLYLHNNQSASRAAQSGSKAQGLIQGEALLSLHNFNIEDAKSSDLHLVQSNLSFLSAIKLFQRASQSNERSAKLTELAEGLDFEHFPVTQLSKDSITTLTPHGWLVDQLPNRENSDTRPGVIAEPDQIHTMQEKSQADRRRSRLHGLHILFPSNNEKDELLSISMSTNLRPIGCESESENAHLDSHMDDDSIEETAMRSYRILGRRSVQSQWHLHCLLDGRITTATRIRLTPRLNNQSIPRERIGLGEFSLPVRGFLWRSPETIELTGAQILDATAAVQSADKDSASQTSVVLWTDLIPTGLTNARAVFSFSDTESQQSPAPLSKPHTERLSGK